jgi:hypothetical protein
VALLAQTLHETVFNLAELVEGLIGAEMKGTKGQLDTGQYTLFWCKLQLEGHNHKTWKAHEGGGANHYFASCFTTGIYYDDNRVVSKN